jgi:hypothetical protein
MPCIAHFLSGDWNKPKAVVSTSYQRTTSPDNSTYTQRHCTGSFAALLDLDLLSCFADMLWASQWEASGLRGFALQQPCCGTACYRRAEQLQTSWPQNRRCAIQNKSEGCLRAASRQQSPLVDTEAVAIMMNLSKNATWMYVLFKAVNVLLIQYPVITGASVVLLWYVFCMDVKERRASSIWFSLILQHMNCFLFVPCAGTWRISYPNEAKWFFWTRLEWLDVLLSILLQRKTLSEQGSLFTTLSFWEASLSSCRCGK